MKKHWKTLAWPMSSMNLWFSKDSPETSQGSIQFNKFMENIGLANVFHEFVVSKDSSETSEESTQFNKFMENIGLANVFHGFL